MILKDNQLKSIQNTNLIYWNFWKQFDTYIPTHEEQINQYYITSCISDASKITTIFYNSDYLSLIDIFFSKI